MTDRQSIKLHETPVNNLRRMYIHSWAATREMDELFRFKSLLLLPLFKVVFKQIYAKKPKGGVTPPGKLQL